MTGIAADIRAPVPAAVAFRGVDGVTMICLIARSPTDVERAPDVISTKRSSSPSDCSNSAFSALARISTSACSDEPISPRSRNGSSCFCTSDRTARTASSSSISAASSASDGQSGKRLGKDRAAVFLLQYLPRLFGGKRQQRRHQLQQRLGDQIKRACADRRAFESGLRRVQPVLQDVEVKRAEVFGRKGLQPCDDRVVLVAVVVGLRARGHLAHHRQCIAVDLEPLGDRQHVALRIEVADIGQQEAQRVAQSSIAFNYPFQISSDSDSSPE